LLRITIITAIRRQVMISDAMTLERAHEIANNYIKTHAPAPPDSPPRRQLSVPWEAAPSMLPKLYKAQSDQQYASSGRRSPSPPVQQVHDCSTVKHR
jgi:hypothetical protein